MQEVVLGETDLMECAKCGGIWVDADTFEHICANKEAQAAVLHQWPSPPPANRVEQVHYRPCAACGRMMNRINFERMSGTVIDVCKGHGTFLDAGELHQIVTFIHGGGLERARERQIDDLKSAEARLRAAEDAQAIRDARFDAWHGNRVWQGPDLLELLRRLSRS
jgi:Zn-finger nucleic acid-binding protein